MTGSPYKKELETEIQKKNEKELNLAKRRKEREAKKKPSTLAPKQLPKKKQDKTTNNRASKSWTILG